MGVVYHCVNGLTGANRVRVHPDGAPAWARRPEPVAWSASFNITPDPTDRGGQVVEGNPSAGLNHRLVPWRDVLVASWQAPDGTETALAAGIVSSPLRVDEEAGTLSVDTVCARTLMDDRQLLHKSAWPPTKQTVKEDGYSLTGLVSRIVYRATLDYAALPAQGFSAVPGFGLPIDLPPATPGPHSLLWYGYNFKTAAEALDDLEEEFGVVVDFRPYWTSNHRFRWSLEVWEDEARNGQVLNLGHTGARPPQAVYKGTDRNSKGLYTVTHHTGKGSEVDILYDRLSDTTPTVMARETLMARPDVETRAQLNRQKVGLYANARSVIVQDELKMHHDETNPAWRTPADLRLGQTVQVALADSYEYGATTLRRTLIGWRAAGENVIDLEVQDLTADSGV